MTTNNPNDIEIDGETVRIRVDSNLHGTQYILVDLADYEDLNLRDYRWHVARQHQMLLARTNVRQGSRWATVNMHTLILPDYEVAHADHDGLNNTRRNLRVAEAGMETYCPNDIEIDGETVKIRVDSETFGTKYILVDLADYTSLDLRDYRWYVTRIGKMFYAGTSIGRAQVYMHQLIFPEAVLPLEVIHVGHDGLDNRRSELRVGNSNAARMNARKRADNKSGAKGVSWYKPYGKWRARIHVNGRMIQLGYFEDIEDAKAARAAAAKQHFGEYAREG